MIPDTWWKICFYATSPWLLLQYQIPTDLLFQQSVTQQLQFIGKVKGVMCGGKGGRTEEDIRPEGVLGTWRQQLSPDSSGASFWVGAYLWDKSMNNYKILCLIYKWLSFYITMELDPRTTACKWTIYEAFMFGCCCHCVLFSHFSRSPGTPWLHLHLDHLTPLEAVALVCRVSHTWHSGKLSSCCVERCISILLIPP